MTTKRRLSEFFVDGTTIPEVDFDVGPSWSGLLPISNKTGEQRQVRVADTYGVVLGNNKNLNSSSSGSSLPGRKEVSMTSFFGQTAGQAVHL